MKWKPWWKKKEPVVRFPDVAERVARGAALLDAERAGWQWEVNPDKIDLFSYAHCILGQIYGGYADGTRRLGPAMTDNPDVYGYNPTRYGFTVATRGRELDTALLSELTAEALEMATAWKREILFRRAPDLAPRARYIY